MKRFLLNHSEDFRDQAVKGINGLFAFDLDNLALSGNAGGSKAPRQWQYVSEDSLATMDSAGYFNDAAKLLRPGDGIRAVVVGDLTADPWVPSDAGNLLVLSNTGTVVDTSDETAITVTDSD